MLSLTPQGNLSLNDVRAIAQNVLGDGYDDAVAVKVFDVLDAW